MLNTHSALAQMNRLRDELDRAFTTTNWTRADVFPPVNVWQDESSLYVEAELPGLKMDDLEIYIHDGELSIKGSRPKVELENAQWLRQERGHGEFSRTFKLNLDIDVEK